MPPPVLTGQPSSASSSHSENPRPPKRNRVRTSIPKPHHSQDSVLCKDKQDRAEKFALSTSLTSSDAKDQPLPLHGRNVAAYPAESSSAGTSHSALSGLPSGNRDSPQGTSVKRAYSVERPLEFGKRPPTQAWAPSPRHAHPTTHPQHKEEPFDALFPLDLPLRPESHHSQELPLRPEPVTLRVKAEDSEAFLLGSEAPETKTRDTPVVARIKEELPDPSEVIIPERKLVTESCSFYPIPNDCRKFAPGYKENRVAFFQNEYKRLQSFGLRKRKVVFRCVLFLLLSWNKENNTVFFGRDDGMAIEWYGLFAS